MKLRLTNKVTMTRIMAWMEDESLEVVTAISTPWWSLWDERWMPYRNDVGLPCDPRGSMLMQGNAKKFWKAAMDNPSRYGEHGITALVAAFHTNVEVLTENRGWRPTSLDSWDAYNRLIIEEIERKQGDLPT